MKSTQTIKPKTIKLISYSFCQTSYSKCYKSQCHPTEENVWWYFLIERCYQCHVLYKVQYSVTVRNKKQQIWSVIHNWMKIVSKGVAFVNIFVRWWLRKIEAVPVSPLIVVPWNKLHERVIEPNPCLCIEYTWPEMKQNPLKPNGDCKSQRLFNYSL